MYDKHGDKNPNYRHGFCKSNLYNVYAGMRDRCTNPNAEQYAYYGGRGIKVCDEWSDKKNGRVAFFEWAINNGYKAGLSIDRMDVNGDYEPSNCQWVGKGIQSFNQRQRKSKLGVRGVYYRESTRKYLVSIGENGRQHHIGCYDNINDAIAARKEAEMKYYGMTMDDKQGGKNGSQEMR